MNLLQAKRAKAIFDSFDKDLGGTISITELSQSLSDNPYVAKLLTVKNIMGSVTGDTGSSAL